MQQWVYEPEPGQDVAAGLPAALARLAYSGKQANGSGGFPDPIPKRFPTPPPVAVPPLQRSSGSPGSTDFGAAAGGCAGVTGAGGVPLVIVGLMRLTSDSESALAPWLALMAPTLVVSRRPAEPPELAAVPQAAVSSTAVTRSTRSLFIATGITQRATLTDGLDAALPWRSCYRAVTCTVRRPPSGSSPQASRRARSI